MLLEEFSARTGYVPTLEAYREIEEEYYDFPGDKDAFCEAWKEEYECSMNGRVGQFRELVSAHKVWD